MGTLVAVYVRNEEPAAAEQLRAVFPTAEHLDGSEFVGAVLDPRTSSPPQATLSGLSSTLETDVVWLCFQSAVDAFEFHHWRCGVSVRALVFGCYHEERTWEAVEGEAEPWEREAFFELQQLTRKLEWTEDAAEKRELERIWRNAELVVGRTEPNIDARESARAAAEYYCFPGWD